MANAVNIPQANSVETLVYVVEALRDGVDTVSSLVREFDVRERTIHYYLELAEWLGLVENRQAAQLALTPNGARFANDVDARGRLYHDQMMSQPLVQDALARTELRDYESLKSAFAEVIAEVGALSDATATRRAGALATLVQAAFESDGVEWTTGRIGQPTRMRRTYAAHDAPPDDDSDTTTWERPRDPEGLVGAERFAALAANIAAVLETAGPATSSEIRDQLALRWEVPLTDPSVFVVLRSGLEAGRWRADQNGNYSLS